MRGTNIFYWPAGISKIFKRNFLFTVLFIGFSLISFGQDTTAQKQYVKIEVGMHILDCPVLPKNLKEKLLTVQGIKDYREDMMTQSIYFNVPEGALSKEQIMTIATSCAFPPNSISVLLDKKPFTN
jgi:hypothetical protein